MTASLNPAPVAEFDAASGELRLRGQWTLAQATSIAHALAKADGAIKRIDARNVDALDSLGVLQLQHFALDHGMGRDQFAFRPDHHALVEAIVDVGQDRPKHTRDLGFRAALGRLGYAVAGNWREIVALASFFGECIVKTLRLFREPRRLRVTSVVHHMEQVGLDAVPLVLLLTFLVGAVLAFLGANILRDFGATILVVDLVNIAFLREFAVLLTAILLAGRTASAFTAQIGAMVSREEVDAIRTLGLDPVDLLVIPRVLALIIMLPLLTFLAMVAGLIGGLSVGAFSLDIPPPAYLARIQETIDIGDFWVGMSKAPAFALVIGLIGCLEGLQVKGTAQSVGERTTSSVVQTISLVIVLDALAAIWFMHMGW
ncbi:ABC transporter permease [Lysobacter pythonis]|uniref:ABC transporter permease n=1 Tax=Solilutibacter pythonis TaxID=2483112 RepID=A0A3M2HYK2_9GAMM|nr:ABC transporter permease [Lysobacter pythonis]RMH93325.1 ABC transporter permease [Lysobacter pythonis]